MMVEVPAFTQAFVADGTAAGSIQVADSSGFYPGCEAFLIRTDGTGQRCVIVSVPDSSHVVVRAIADDNENQLSVQRYGGGSNLTSPVAWTVAGGAKLSMPLQLARIEPTFYKPTSRNV